MSASEIELKVQEAMKNWKPDPAVIDARVAEVMKGWWKPDPKVIEAEVNEAMKDWKPDPKVIDAEVAEAMKGWKPDPKVIDTEVAEAMKGWNAERVEMEESNSWGGGRARPRSPVTYTR